MFPSDIRLLSGITPVFASTFDQRFSFALHIPRSHKPTSPELPLLVVVHGLSRRIGPYLDKLADFSETHNCVIMCPLFPAGIIDPEDMDNYRTILYKDIRYDLVLLSMVEQISKIWRIRSEKFYLHGFSGGGQFAHRFFYLHSDRLIAVSIAAPGNITTPNIERPWPLGLSDAAEKFGIPDVPDFEMWARVPIQLVVGAEDHEILESIAHASDGAGKTRIDKIKSLDDSFRKIGLRPELTIVPGVAHDGQGLLSALESWLDKIFDLRGEM
jgi:hypothetical protein